MPQKSRKTPFSGKAKKQQIQEKREKKKRQQEHNGRASSGPKPFDTSFSPSGRRRPLPQSPKLHQKHQSRKNSADGDEIESAANAGRREEVIDLTPTSPTTRKRQPPSSSRSSQHSTQRQGRDQHRALTTIFAKESDEAIRERKLDGTRKLERRVGQSPYLNGFLSSVGDLDLPKRPEWSSETSPEELDELERREFDLWLHDIVKTYPQERLNFFEQNLEVWRQLWRVLEKCDILIYLLDARFPLLHFGRKLYDHITLDHGKEVVVCINKADLVAPEAVEEWMKYFQTEIPGINVTYFHSNKGGNPRATHSPEDVKRLMQALSKCKVRRDGREVSAASYISPYVNEEFSHLRVEEAETRFHLSETASVSHGEYRDRKHQSKQNREGISSKDDAAASTGENLAQETEMSQQYIEGDFIMLGVVGDPNMGKSTLMNNIFQRKVVSHSSTPGHTKHFQTMFLSKSICFCDCPGVVLPKLDIPRPLQVLIGNYPIAQVREPYSALRYLAEFCDPPLEKLYHLKPDEDDDHLGEWSPYKIAEAYAVQRGFHTRGGRPDTYRASNRLLREAMNGWKVILSFMPPDWYANGPRPSPLRQEKVDDDEDEGRNEVWEGGEESADDSEVEDGEDEDDDEEIESGEEETELSSHPVPAGHNFALLFSNSSDDEDDD